MMKKISVSIGSFNIGGLLGSDGIDARVGKTDKEAMVRRAEAAASAIEKQEIDIIALQEVPTGSAGRLIMERLGIEQAGCIYMEGSRPGTGVLVGSRLPIDRRRCRVLRSVRLLSGNNVAFRRPVVKATIVLPGGVDLVVFNAHLKSNFVKVEKNERNLRFVKWFAERKGDAAEVRAREAVALRELLVKEIGKSNGGGVVLVGDLNDIWGSATLAIIMGTSLFADCSEEQRRFFAPYLLLSPSMMPAPKRNQVDFIFVSAVLRLAEMEVSGRRLQSMKEKVGLDESGGGRLFDHSPLIARLALSQSMVEAGISDSELVRLHKLSVGAVGGSTGLLP